jgi:hypothetical protein
VDIPTMILARTSPLVVIAVSPQSPYWDKSRRLARVSVPLKHDSKLKANRLSVKAVVVFSSFCLIPMAWKVAIRIPLIEDNLDHGPTPCHCGEQTSSRF